MASCFCEISSEVLTVNGESFFVFVCFFTMMLNWGGGGGGAQEW